MGTIFLVYIYILCMIKVKVRWFTCTLEENML